MIDIKVFEAAHIQNMVDAFKALSPEGLSEAIDSLGADHRRRIFSMSGYCAQLPDADFFLYVELVSLSAQVIESRYVGQKYRAGEHIGAISGFLWLDSLMEECAKRGSALHAKTVFDASFEILRCLQRMVTLGGIDRAESQKPISNWFRGFMYVGDGSIKLDLDTDMVKFMNRVIVGRDENLFQTMVYTLKQRATIETQGQGVTAATAKFAQYLAAFVPSLAQFSSANSLKIFPDSFSKILGTVMNLQTYANRDDEHLLIPARDALIDLVSDPTGLGKSLLNRNLAPNTAPHKLIHVSALIKGVQNDTLPATQRDRLEFSVALSTLNACAKLLNTKENHGLIKAKVTSLMSGKDEVYVQRLMDFASKPAKQLLGEVIHEKRPEFRNCVSEKGMTEMLERDLGL